jgi:hypothetical protein
MKTSYKIGDLVLVTSYVGEHAPGVGIVIGDANAWGVYPVFLQLRQVKRFYATGELEKLDD